MTMAFWICAFVTLASAVISFGFSIVALSASNDNSKTNAMYASSRSFALVIASLVAFFYHSIVWLAAISTIMILVQFADAIIGIKTRDNLKTYGPVFTAIINLIALIFAIQ